MCREDSAPANNFGIFLEKRVFLLQKHMEMFQNDQTAASSATYWCCLFFSRPSTVPQNIKSPPDWILLSECFCFLQYPHGTRT